MLTEHVIPTHISSGILFNNIKSIMLVYCVTFNKARHCHVVETDDKNNEPTRISVLYSSKKTQWNGSLSLIFQDRQQT